MESPELTANLVVPVLCEQFPENPDLLDRPDRSGVLDRWALKAPMEITEPQECKDLQAMQAALAPSVNPVDKENLERKAPKVILEAAHIVLLLVRRPVIKKKTDGGHFARFFSSSLPFLLIFASCIVKRIGLSPYFLGS